MESLSKPIKLAICIPSGGSWAPDFGYSLARMCSYMTGYVFEERQQRDIVFVDKRTSNLPRSRQECLEDAQLQECTHALFLDTDQVFPPETAHRLLRWKKPIVACSIPLKIIPSYPTARVRGTSPFGVPLYSNHANAKGLEKVWRVGTGVMLIDLAVLDRIEKPWFEIVYSKQFAQFVGEDYYFCEKLEKAGIDILIDHELSREVQHVGNFNFTHAHIPQMLEEAAA